MEWGGKWDNCNSIINKYIFKKLKKKERNRELKAAREKQSYLQKSSHRLSADLSRTILTSFRKLTELVEFGHKFNEKNGGYAKGNKGKCTGNQ